MKKQRLVMDLRKAQPLMSPDGELTDQGHSVARAYARQWLRGVRDLASERQYPELTGFFYDVRSDSTLARTLAT